MRRDTALHAKIFPNYFRTGFSHCAKHRTLKGISNAIATRSA